MENNCVFCDRSKIEEQIIAEVEDWYVIATLGQIAGGGYSLLIPKTHVPCAGALSPEQTEFMFGLVGKVCRAIALEYKRNELRHSVPVTVFEHGIVGQSVKHAHIHFLPASVDFAPRIKADFPSAEIRELASGARLREEYAKRSQPYLFWQDGAGRSIVCWNPPAPPQYLRLIAADIMGCPEQGDWRQIDKEADKKLWQETVIRLKPYF